MNVSPVGAVVPVGPAGAVGLVDPAAGDLQQQYAQQQQQYAQQQQQYEQQQQQLQYEQQQQQYEQQQQQRGCFITYGDGHHLVGFISTSSKQRQKKVRQVQRALLRPRLCPPQWEAVARLETSRKQQESCHSLQ